MVEEQVPPAGAGREAASNDPTGTRGSVRQKILDSASALVGERPISDITLRDISARAGLHHSLITRHFGTKEELMYEVGLRSRAEYTAVVRDSPDPIEGFHRAFEFLLEDPARAKFFTQTVLAQVNEHDTPGVYPGWMLHVAQLREIAADPGPGPEAPPSSPAADKPVDIRVLVMATMLLMGAWALAEDWVRSANLPDLELEEMRRSIHDIIDRLLRRELGLGTGLP